MGRLAGGSAFLLGMLVMAYNVFMTIRGSVPAVEIVPGTQRGATAA
jgi:cbb3-type cytochrome oxidase subunit 1